jgi:hypothetical protein
MPQPTAQALHVDRFLTNMSVAWAQDQAQFVADKVFPIVPVLKASDLYSIYSKGFFFRDELRPRPMGGRPQQAGYEVTSGRYSAEEYALEHLIDDRVRENADQPLDPDRAAMRLLTTQALIHRDMQWASKYFTTGVWHTDETGVSANPGANQFLQFDQTGGDPIKFFGQQRINMASGTGYPANTLVLGPDTYQVIRNNPAVIDRVKYTQRGVITTELLAELFDVDQVLVPGGVINSAAEGQTDAIDFIVGRKGALLTYAAPAPSIDQPSGGYTFAWVGLLPGNTNAFGGVLERGREELAHSDVVQIRLAFDLQVVASDLGIFFQKCVA